MTPPRRGLDDGDVTAPVAPPAPTAPPDAHARSIDDVAGALAVDPAAGLSSLEAATRARTFGSNELEPAHREGILGRIVEGVTEPFILLLLAAGVGAVLLGEVRDGILILIALIPIVGADVVTEYRADRALDALREASAPQARVRRDDAIDDRPAVTLVPGDVVLLRVGDVVPADLRLTRMDRLLVDRSILTGESVPEPGSVAADAPGATLIERRSMAYAGTSVVGGRGEGLVVAIGRMTEVGRIAGGLGARGSRRSPLQRELDRLVKILLVVAVTLIVIVTGLGFLRGQPPGANLLAGISAAIAAIPEEPPILLAVVLGLGAYRLLRRGVLVRRLNAQETLGAIDLIITDKTGTLTRNRLDVASMTTLDGPVTDPAMRRALLVAAFRAEDDAWAVAGGSAPGSFTQAFARAADAAGGDTRLDPADLIDTEPVTEGRPTSLVTARRDGVEETLLIGAPEAVLDRATTDASETVAWTAIVEDGARRGERLVALAAGERGGSLRMRAVIGLADPIRDGIPASVAMALEAGIQVVMITGDHPVTALAIARAAGLEAERAVLGDDLAAEDDAQVIAGLPGLRVIARSTPAQKARVVRLARGAGRTVAVTGDGVNDAPALHGADVAVAMGSGSAVAKEAADLVLGDDSFVTLLDALREGRRIVDNIQKGLVFLTSTHVALLGFILIATVYGFGQPLLPIQILWMELFIDISTSVAFEREAPEPGIMSRPPRRARRPLLPYGLLARIGVAGGFSAVAAFVILITDDGTPDHARWLAYTALVCGQAVRANANRSLRFSVHRLPANWLLLGAAVVAIAIQALIPFVPVLADAFRATHLSLADWLLVAIVALAPAMVVNLARTAGRRDWVA